jgi:hypothetical protein
MAIRLLRCKHPYMAGFPATKISSTEGGIGEHQPMTYAQHTLTAA